LAVSNRYGVNIRLTSRCLKSTKRGGAQLKNHSSNDLGIADLWINHEALVPDADGTINGVIFDTTEDGDFINITADVTATKSKLFVRLHGGVVN
jgi:hypothetical protein